MFHIIYFVEILRDLLQRLHEYSVERIQNTLRDPYINSCVTRKLIYTLRVRGFRGVSWSLALAGAKLKFIQSVTWLKNLGQLQV